MHTGPLPPDVSVMDLAGFLACLLLAPLALLVVRLFGDGDGG